MLDGIPVYYNDVTASEIRGNSNFLQFPQADNKLVSIDVLFVSRIHGSPVIPITKASNAENIPMA